MWVWVGVCWWVRRVFFLCFQGLAVGAGLHLSLCPAPSPPRTPPHPSIHPSLSTLSSLLLSGFFRGCAHNPHPPSSQTALPHQFLTVPAWRGVRERKEELEERIWWTEDRQTGERDHGCSLCLAEDLGNTADLVPGSGPSGKWTGELETCLVQAQLLYSRVQWEYRPLEIASRHWVSVRWYYELCAVLVLVDVIKML